MNNNKEDSKTTEIGNVSDRVLDVFVNKLAAEKEYSDVASRLKGVLFNDKVSEKSLRTALFGEDEE